MKKIILTTSVLALLFSTSCNKDDDNNNGNGSLEPVQVQRALLVESTGTGLANASLWTLRVMDTTGNWPGNKGK